MDIRCASFPAVATTVLYLMAACNGTKKKDTATTATSSNVSPTARVSTSAQNSLAVGCSHSLFRSSNGSLWVTGTNDVGQLGIGNTTNQKKWIQSPIEGVIFTSAGCKHSLAIKNDSSLWATGLNEDGQLGTGDTTSLSTTSRRTSQGLESVDYSSGFYADEFEATYSLERLCKAIQADKYKIALRSTERTVEWLNEILKIPNLYELWLKKGKLENLASSPSERLRGLVKQTERSRKKASFRQIPRWEQTAVQQLNRLILEITYPECPTNHRTSWTSSFPDARAAAAGSGSESLLVKKDGTIWLTGISRRGALGTEEDQAHLRSVRKWEMAPITHSPVEFITVATREDHSLALSKDGDVWITGWNETGAHGVGDIPTISYVTKFIFGGSKKVFEPFINSWKASLITDVSEVAAGCFHSLVLKRDGSLWGAGQNEYGQLGLGDKDNKKSWTPLPLTDVTSMAAGCHHSLALKNDGTLWGTGNNGSGQLGLGDEQSKTQWAPVLSDVVAVATGNHHSLAVRKDGSVWGTGSNADGELGVDDVTTCKKWMLVLPARGK